MKRLVSFILSIIMLLALSTPVLATNGTVAYSDEELIEAASNYYENTYGSKPPHVTIDNRNGDDVVIHLYEVANNHTATWDWYTVNRFTGGGTDFMGNTITLFEQSSIVQSGVCGNNLTWTLDSNGTLTVSGTGEIPDYNYPKTPWYNAEDKIKKIVVGNGVTRIGNSAFTSCQNVSDIVLPNSLVSIGERAFAGCIALTTIEIPYGVERIERGAFGSCENLTNISLPDTLLTIGNEVFSLCYRLESITIPESVNEISYEPFYACSGLKSIEVSPGNSTYASKDGVLFNKDMTEIIAYPRGREGEYTIPSSVRELNAAFATCLKLTKVVIPNGVKTIGIGVFLHCTSLSAIVIPPSVEHIDEGAFWSCSKDLTIFCVENSAAHKYAIQYNIPFELIDYEPSDAPPDSTLDIDFDGVTRIDLHWNQELFNKNASEYDHNLAMAALLLTRATYDGEDVIRSKLEALGFDSILHLHYDGDYYVDLPAMSVGAREINNNGKQEIVIVVAIRGSQTIADFYTDLSALWNGFLDATTNTMGLVEACFNRIENEYDCELTKENTKFFVTGHSYGAAVAGMLSNQLLSYAEPEKIFTYTFASPNCDTEKNDYATYTNVHNILNTNDEVRNVPWGYKRYGHDWYYDLDSIQDTISSVYERYPDKGVDAHSHETYLACLLSGLPKNMGAGATSLYNLSSIHCPVDITVYDEHGNKLGFTSGSEVTLLEESDIIFYTMGDSKFVMSPQSINYRIEFTATGDGTMTYTQSVVDTISGNTTNEKAFSNVELTSGKKMVAEVNDSSELIELKLFVQDEDGNIIAEVSPASSEKSSNPPLWIYVLVIGIVVIAGTIVAALKIARKRKIIMPNSKERQVQVNEKQTDKHIDDEWELFCSKCGTPFAEGGLFCAKCGNPRRSLPAGETTRRIDK